MSQKQLRFAVNQIILEGHATFTPEDFFSIESETIDPVIFNKGTTDEETLSIKRIEKKVIDDRFVTLYFRMGEKYPYSKTVVDKDLTEHDNPRPPDQIELDDQYFALIDSKFQRIYASEQRRKGLVLKWLNDTLPFKVFIKAIIEEKEFLNKIRTINSLSFTVAPNLFNSKSGVLSEHLLEDMFGFGAEKAHLKFEYGNTKVSDQIGEKISSLLGRKYEYEDITVIGRSDGEMESILNLEEITNTIIVDAALEANSKLLDPDEVFGILITKLNR